MEITEFLLARTAERRALVEAVLTETPDGLYIDEATRMMLEDAGMKPAWARLAAVVSSPARVLAECVTKRRIVDEHVEVNDGDCGTCVSGQWGYPTHGGSVPKLYPCPTLLALAQPYADHADFDPAWRMESVTT